MTLEAKLERILPQVEKPGRYTGGEWNAVVKDWEAVDVRIALTFPDIYDLGMSNLGLMILYDVVNRQPDLLAERVYAPWVDMEAAMREAGLPLFSLESKRLVAEFDIIGISLPYEQLYTNALNMLDLAGLPVLSAERDARHPLVIAGGSACYNPEPMSPFIDAFVIGEGEEVILELARAYQVWKKGATNCDPRVAREELLRQLSTMEGVYVPRFYEARYNEDGTLQATVPIVDGVPPMVRKRIVPVLPPPVTRFIVPFVDIVHNRAAVEIQRGCTRGCRFCQAGMVYRPVRERPLDEVLAAVDEVIAQTGMEEVALLSLSSSDYSRIRELVEAIAERHTKHHVSIGLPSLRIESFSVELAEALMDGRRSSFTFAPEAATERMRQVINKPIPDAELLQVAEEVFSRGWRSIKLYFMIGQPTETDEDVRAIARLAKQVHAVGRKYHGRKASVRVGVSTFVPKPHTPFQWAPLAALDTIRGRQDILRRELRGRGLTFNWNEPEESLLEAALSRGDRRVGRVIHSAWRAGARFDGWSDQFKADVWWQAFADEGLDPQFYASRPRPADEVFPWDHISIGVHKRWLLRDYQDALAGKIKIDCRERCLGCGILSVYRDLRATTPPEAWECPEVRTHGK